MSQWQLPAVVLTLVTWLTAPSPSLGDLARREALRRQIVPKATQSLVTADLPSVQPGPVHIPVSLARPDDADTPPPAAGQARPAATESAGDKEQREEKFWRDRMMAARQALDRDRMLADAMQSRINALTTDFVNRDDPAQKSVIAQERIKALAELERLKKQVETDEQAIATIQKEAHRQGIPAGWVR